MAGPLDSITAFISLANAMQATTQTTQLTKQITDGMKLNQDLDKISKKLDIATKSGTAFTLSEDQKTLFNESILEDMLAL